MDAAFTACRAVFSELKNFLQSIKDAEKLGEELLKEVSSTQSMVDGLQRLVVEIGLYDIVPANATQPHLKLSDISDEVQDLQKAVEKARTQLEHINHLTGQEKSRQRVIQILRPEKGKDELQALLADLRSIHKSASWLTQLIPM